MNETDICVAGAGPAGLFSSLFLSQLNIPHTLIEKCVFPREKICGDGITVEVMHNLNLLNPLWLDELIASDKVFPCWGIDFTSYFNRKYSLKFDRSQLRYPPMFTMDRKDFDYFLFKKAGAEKVNILQATTIQEIIRDNEKLVLRVTNNTGQKEIKCKVLIMATGANQTFSQSLNKEKIKYPYYSTITGYVNITGDDFMEKPLFLFHKKLIPGYFWVFPMTGNRYNVGLGMIRRNKNHENLKELFFEIVKNNKYIDPALNFVPLNEISFRGGRLFFCPSLKNLRFAQDNVLFTGDAGYLADPFLGKGIGAAAVSGRVAAYTVQKALYANNFRKEFLDGYMLGLKRMYKTEWKINRFLFHWFSNNARIETFASLLAGKFISQKINDKLNDRLTKWL